MKKRELIAELIKELDYYTAIVGCQLSSTTVLKRKAADYLDCWGDDEQ